MDEKPDIQCPQCGLRSQIYLSHWRAFSLDVLMWLRGKRPYRCKKCDARFYADPA